MILDNCLQVCLVNNREYVVCTLDRVRDET